MSTSKKTIQDIRNSLATLGPCYVDPKFIKPGYQYRLVSDEPGRVASLERLGYTIVKNTDEDDIQVGEETRSKSHSHGSAVVTYYKSTIPLILMCIPQDLFDEIEKCKALHMNDIEKSMYEVNGIPQANTYGDIKTFLK